MPVYNAKDLMLEADALSYANLIDKTKMSPRRYRMLGLLYLAWLKNRLALYPLLVLPHVVPFHQSYKRMRGLFGGNRSSKTFSSAAEFAMVATGQHFWRHPATLPKPPFQMWVVTEDFKTAWDVQLQAILHWMPPNFVTPLEDHLRWSGSNHDLVVSRPDGDVTIQFRSWTQGFKRQRGRFVPFIWFDEEPEDEDVFREMEFRTLGMGVGSTMVSCTPQSGTMSYLYDRFIENKREDPEVEYWLLNSYDNFYLDLEALQRLDEMSIGDDEAERDMRIKGLFAVRTGKVYKNYNDTYYDEDDNPTGCLYRKDVDVPIWFDRYMALDPGFGVCAVGWYAVDPANGDIYKYREARFENEAMSTIAKRIKIMCGNERIEFCVVDGSEPNAAEELRQFGIRTALDRDFAANLEDFTEKGRKRAGIERVRNYLAGASGPRLFICETCEHTRREFNRYAYNDHGDPQKENDHHLDETRYMVSSRPKSETPKIMLTGAAPTMDQLIQRLEAQRQNPFNIVGGREVLFNPHGEAI